MYQTFIQILTAYGWLYMGRSARLNYSWFILVSFLIFLFRLLCITKQLNLPGSLYLWVTMLIHCYIGVNNVVICLFSGSTGRSCI